MSIGSKLVWLAIAALSILGCTGDNSGGSVSQGPEPSAEVSSTIAPPGASPTTTFAPVDEMTVTPDPASPGQVVELRFPPEYIRGVGMEFQRRVDAGWERTHWMISDGNSVDEMTTFEAVDDGIGTIDVGLAGPEPDRVILPEDLEDGRYRICTWNIDEAMCVELEVAG